MNCLNQLGTLTSIWNGSAFLPTYRGRKLDREITYNNFEISLVVFMLNITTNHAITLAVTTNRRPQRFFLRFKPAVWWTSINLYHGFPRFSSTRRNMLAFKPFLQYFATGSDTASSQDYEEYEIVECLSEEIQIIDFTQYLNTVSYNHIHICKLSQYTLATRLRFGKFIFENSLCSDETFVPCRCDIFRSFEFMLLGNRPFPHSCAQRFQVETWVD